MWKGAVGPHGAGDASMALVHTFFLLFERGEEILFYGGISRTTRGGQHIGDLEMTYATHEWNCGELLDQGGLLRGKKGRANAGQRREGGEGGAGERAAGGEMCRTRACQNGP